MGLKDIRTSRFVLPEPRAVEALQAPEVLALMLEAFPGRVALACSFQKEETVLLDMLFSLEPQARVFAIDTHHLFPETYELWREVERRYAYNQTDPMVSVKVKHSIDPLLVTAGHPFYAIRGVPMEQANARTLEWLAKGKVKAEWLDAGELLEEGNGTGRREVRDDSAEPRFNARHTTGSEGVFFGHFECRNNYCRTRGGTLQPRAGVR